MKTWKQARQDSLVSGSIASLLSTAVLAVRGQRDAGSPFAPTNAISHWIWGDHAALHDEPSKLAYHGRLCNPSRGLHALGRIV